MPSADNISCRTLDDRFDFVSTAPLYGTFDCLLSDVQKKSASKLAPEIFSLAANSLNLDLSVRATKFYASLP